MLKVKKTAFRAISRGAYGHENNHEWLRKEMCNYLERNADNLSWVVTPYSASSQAYVNSMRRNGAWGGTTDALLLSKFLQRPIKYVARTGTKDNVLRAVTYKPTDSSYSVLIVR